MPHKTHFLLPPSALCQDVELVLIKPNIPLRTLALVDHEPSWFWFGRVCTSSTSHLGFPPEKIEHLFFSGKRKIINEGQKCSPISVRLHSCSICANLVSNSSTTTSWTFCSSHFLRPLFFFTTIRKLMMQNLKTTDNAYGTSQGGFSRLHI